MRNGIISGYDDELTNVPVNRPISPAISPALAVNPEATSNPSNGPEKLPANHSFRIQPAFVFTMALPILLAIF